MLREEYDNRRPCPECQTWSDDIEPCSICGWRCCEDCRCCSVAEPGEPICLVCANPGVFVDEYTETDIKGLEEFIATRG